ncbi:MAG: hypothetical protein AAGB04_06480 [Pseudomonadota bacterium]
MTPAKFDPWSALKRPAPRAKRANCAKDGSELSTFSTFSTPSVPDFSDFEERAAIIEICGGVSRCETAIIAARQHGFEDVVELYAVHIAEWQRRLSRTNAVSDEHQRLVANAFILCRSNWILQILSLGWDEVGIFAYEPGAHTGGLLHAVGDGALTVVTQDCAGFVDLGGKQRLHRRFSHTAAHLLWDL